MHIEILRRTPGASFSMDVYTSALIAGLNEVRPEWKITEQFPRSTIQSSRTNSLLKGIQKYYQRYWQYPKQLQQCKADIVHVIDQSDGYLVSHLQGSNAHKVVTCHDLINLIHPELFQDRARFPWLSMAVWKRSLKGMYKADRVITVSEHTAKDVVQHLQLPPSRVKSIPNGVESDFQPMPSQNRLSLREQFEIPQESFCLLNVGSNNPRKNIITALKAVERLRHDGVPVYFCKAGDDFTDEQKQFITEHQLTHCVAYTGKPDKSTLVRLYNAADVLVAPSTYEGFGITILEAMACGLPVITANVTSLPEVAGDAAILIDPLDIEAIQEAAKDIFNDPALSQHLSEKGIDQAKRFSWKATAEQVAQVYESLVYESPIEQKNAVAAASNPQAPVSIPSTSL